MEKTKLKIRIFGEQVLRKKAKPVIRISPEHCQILSRMAEAMYEGCGIGLAASQVGISQQLIVIDIGEGLYKLINPRIVRKQGSQAINEGCLSVPGICVKVKRAKYVWVEALDEDSQPVKIEARDLFACVLQHEIDHLKGKLIIDYASFVEKLRFMGKLEALKVSTRACKLQL